MVFQTENEAPKGSSFSFLKFLSFFLLRRSLSAPSPPSFLFIVQSSLSPKETQIPFGSQVSSHTAGRDTDLPAPNQASLGSVVEIWSLLFLRKRGELVGLVGRKE